MGAIVVTGVPGVGKTTVMNAAADAAKMTIVVYGTEMLKVAQARKLVASRDELRRLPPETQCEVQRAAAEAIARMGEVMVDTHCTVRTPRGWLPGLPAWVLEKLKPSAIVLVEASPREIRARRDKDASRERDPDSVEEIELHQALNRAAAMAYAALSGATVTIVTNHDGQVGEAIRQMLPVVGR